MATTKYKFYIFSINQSINQSINLPIYLSVNQSINQSINTKTLILKWAPADKRDLSTFCNKLTNTHLKSVKGHNFYCHSKGVLSCVMHNSNASLLNLRLFWAKSRECCHGNRITESPHIYKILEVQQKQGSVATKFSHFEGIFSPSHKRNIFLFICLNYDVVLSHRVLYHIHEEEQR